MLEIDILLTDKNIEGNQEKEEGERKIVGQKKRSLKQHNHLVPW